VNILLEYGLGIAVALFVLWLALLVILLVKRPSGTRIAELASLLPDLVRLTSRLARDREIPRRVRWRVWVLLAWMASPIDLIPDFIPVIGFADDIVLAYFVLRSVARTAGPEIVEQHWPGTPEGLVAVRQLLKL
jgi:uncharacterized membrane protein YkvA (DUF1232 family)